MEHRNKYLLLNYLFIFCLIILFLNDHILKFEFSNQITGKLSDIAGIIILPLLLTYIFPKLKTYSLGISAIIFTFWKSEFSEGFINFYNQYSLIPITRVIDYSDLLVLLLLPVPYYIIQKIRQWHFLRIDGIHPLFLFVPSLFILMATSPPPSFYYTYSNGNLNCNKCSFTTNYSQKQIVEKLRQQKIVFDTITPISEHSLKRIPGLAGDSIHFYKLNQLIIDGDTLRNIDLSMRSLKNGNTKIYFNGMRVKEDMSRMNLITKARKHYRKILFKELKEAIKNN